MENGLYLGIMSGTSMDGIDASLVEFNSQGQTHIARHNRPWPAELQLQLRSITHSDNNEIERLGILDARVAEEFAQCALDLIQKADIKPQQIAAIGSHGQTIRHRPDAIPAFTIQIGDPNRIAELTGITTVADFRRRDIAAGGQGAPLVCAFHDTMFRKGNETRIILNLGGIANITLLPGDPNEHISGFDTGPGNTLLDAWARRHLDVQFDDMGQWGAGGKVDESLLDEMLKDDYFHLEPPKSTGPEKFNLAWLDSILPATPVIDPQDVQTTLIGLTSATITRAVEQSTHDCDRVIVCGGGVYNKELMKQLQAGLGDVPLEASSVHGIEPDSVEAVAFAWLARQALLGLPGNSPAVTGASGPRILGGIYPGTAA